MAAAVGFGCSHGVFVSDADGRQGVAKLVHHLASRTEKALHPRPTIRKFVPIFDSLTVFRTVFGMVFGLSARFRRGVRAGLAKWLRFGGWFLGWSPRGPPPHPSFGERAARPSPAPSWGRILRKVPHLPPSAPICSHLGAEFASVADPSPMRIPIGISLQFGRTRVIDGIAR